MQLPSVPCGLGQGPDWLPLELTFQIDSQYARLLATLDEAASRAIGDALKAMDDVLCEPAVARILSEHLPTGELEVSIADVATPCLSRMGSTP